MNTQDESLAVTEGRAYKKLEALPEEKREMIVELAAHTRKVDLVEILREHGVETSVSTLKRFLRKQREREVLEEGEEMRENVEALAARGRGESLRKGTLEASRQKMYDLALTSEDPEAAKELYRDFLKEEAKLKELELEGRKAAALEEGIKLQKLRIQIQAGHGRERTSPQLRDRQRSQKNTVVMVESAPVVAGELADSVERGIEEGKNRILTEGNEANEEAERGEEKFAELWERMGAILNRGGRAEEKVLEARAVWEEGRVALGAKNK